MRRNYIKQFCNFAIAGLSMLSAGTITAQTVTTFSYTGGVQTFTVPACVVQVTLEVWGAEGGGSNLSSNSASGLGGFGGYAAGVLTVAPNSTLNIYVGGYGQSSTSGAAAGGFNGGGSGYASSSSEPGNGGGGATDIRLNGSAFSDRVIVAGGGGGGGEDSGDQYGHGGGLTGVGYSSTYDATQTSPGLGGALGIGGTTNMGDGGGGGGGYYGGGTQSSSSIGYDTQGGGGGSGYVGTLTNTTLIAGNASMPNPAGGTMSGRSGHGLARLTYILNGTAVAITNTLAASCNGGNISLTGGGAVTYTWLPVGSFSGSNSGTVVVAPTANTTYTVLGTNSNGCTTEAMVTVTVNTAVPALSVSSSTNSTCLGKSVVLTATGGLAHSWTGGVTNGVPFIPAATSGYTVTGTNGCGSTTSVVTVTVAPLPIGAFASNTLVCQFNTSTLTAAGATNYTWTPGNMTAASVIVTPSVNTIYTVSASDGTCQGTATLQVNTKPNPTITVAASGTNICAGESVTITANGADTYTWNPPAITGNSGVVTPLAPILYQVSGTNSVGCTTGAVQVVVVKATPTISAVSNPTLACVGGSVTLTANSNADTFMWSTGSGSPSTVVYPTTPASYTVTGTMSSSGCSSMQVVSVNVYQPVLPVSPSTTVCMGTPVTLTAGPGTGFVWSNGTTSFNFITVSPTMATTYTVSATTVSNNVSCPASNTIQVGVHPKPVITAAASRTLMCRTKESVTLTVSGADSYVWSNNATGASVTFTSNIIQTHNLSVIGTDANGCTDTAIVVVKVDPCTGIDESQALTGLSLYPNPNNGQFVIRYHSDLELAVINEVGQLVQTVNLNSGNAYTGQVRDLTPGVYFVKGQVNGQAVQQKILVTR